MLILRQSTSIDIRVGPFVDATDAVTPETGITLGAADQAEVLKFDGAAKLSSGDVDTFVHDNVKKTTINTNQILIFIIPPYLPNQHIFSG